MFLTHENPQVNMAVVFFFIYLKHLALIFWPLLLAASQNKQTKFTFKISEENWCWVSNGEHRCIYIESECNFAIYSITFFFNLCSFKAMWICGMSSVEGSLWAASKPWDPPFYL